MNVGGDPFFNKELPRKLEEKSDQSDQLKGIKPLEVIKTQTEQQNKTNRNIKSGDYLIEDKTKIVVNENISIDEKNPITVPTRTKTVDESEKTPTQSPESLWAKICDKNLPLLENLGLIKELLSHPDLIKFINEKSSKEDFWHIDVNDLESAKALAISNLLKSQNDFISKTLLFVFCKENYKTLGLNAGSLNSIGTQARSTNVDLKPEMSENFKYLIKNYKNHTYTIYALENIVNFCLNNAGDSTKQFLEMTFPTIIHCLDDNKSHGGINALYSAFLMSNWNKYETFVNEKMDKIKMLFTNTDPKTLSELDRANKESRDIDFPPNLIKFLSEYKFQDSTLPIFRLITFLYSLPIAEGKWPKLQEKIQEIESKSDLKNLNPTAFLINILLQKNILDFSQSIHADKFSDLNFKPSIKIDGGCDVIQNQNRYLSDEDTLQFPKGTPLSLKKGDFIIDVSDPENKKMYALKDDIPIGYNIHIPKKVPTKAVLVHVYGGFSRDTKDKAFKPNSMSPFEKYLIDQGVAIVKLNLVDYLESDPSKHQSLQSSDLYSKLHASIHATYETIKNNPTSLHNDLSILKNLPLYLMGHSFGGLMAARHPEIYSHTYDGYISSEGALLLKTIEKSGGLSFNISPEGEEIVDSELFSNNLDEIFKGINALSPIDIDKVSKDNKIDKKISQIEDPVLILQNVDDKIINMQVALKWYKKAVENGKGNLVKLFITEEGSKFKGDIRAKGHNPPESTTKAFENYANTLSEFILKGLDNKIPPVSGWQTHRYGILANKNYKGASPTKKFVSEAFRLYEKENPQGLQNDKKITQKVIQAYVEKNWADFLPLYNISELVDILSSYPLKEATLMVNAISAKVNDQQIEKALKIHLPQFIQFLQESDKVNTSTMDIELLSKNPILIEAFREILEEKGPNLNENISVRLLKRVRTLFMDVKMEYLSLLCVANPELMMGYFPADIKKEQKAKNALVNAIFENEKYLQIIKEAKDASV